MRQTSSPTSQGLRNSTDSWWTWRKCNTGGEETDNPSAVQAGRFVPAPLNWNKKDDWQEGAELFSREVIVRWVGSEGLSPSTHLKYSISLINSCLLQVQPELSSTATPLFGGLLHALQEIWVFHFSYCWKWRERSPENSPQNWFLTIYDAPPTLPLLFSDAFANQF